MNARKISIMDFVSDEFISEAAPIHVFDKRYKQRNEMKKVFIRIMATSAAFCLAFAFIFFAVISIYMPVYARTIPFFGSAFAFVQDKLYCAGIYSNYAFEIGDTATDNGISITMSEVYCDGTNLYVSFVVESEKAFSEMSSGDYYMKKQLHYESEAYIIDGANRIKIDKSLGVGVSGLEGEFLDEYTFVGIETFSLDGDASDFPSEFEFEMKINSIGIIASDVTIIKVDGNWTFSVSIKSNLDDVVAYEINKEVNGHAIDKVIVTPVMITIYTSYPDLYSGTTRYEVITYNGLSSDEEIMLRGRYDTTTGVTQVPRNRVDNKLYIYVVDYEQLCESGKKSGAREDIEEHAIVWAEVYID